MAATPGFLIVAVAALAGHSPPHAAGVYQGVPDTPYREDARLRQLPVDPNPAVKNAVRPCASSTAGRGRMRAIAAILVVAFWDMVAKPGL
jgi:hypothetical protein